MLLNSMQRKLPKIKQRNNTHKQTWFLIRVEPYYHKLQYSKVPKGDPAGLIFGITCAMFVFYITLATFGSGGADLADIHILVWYLLLTITSIYLYQRTLTIYKVAVNPFSIIKLLFSWSSLFLFKILNNIKTKLNK